MGFGGSTRSSDGRKKEALTRKRGLLTRNEELFSSWFSREGLTRWRLDVCCCKTKKRCVQDGKKSCCGKEVNTERRSGFL